MLEISNYITPASSVAIAFITACGGLLLRRCFNLKDRRIRQDEKCERTENAYKILSLWERQRQQVIIGLAELAKATEHEQYIISRLRELSNERMPMDYLDPYIDGTAELPIWGAAAEERGGGE